MSLMAVLGDRDSVHEFHCEVWPAVFGGTSIEHAGDIGMVHQGQRLPFGFEPDDDLPRIHSWLDDLQRHLASNGCLLQREIDNSHPSFAEGIENLVGTG